MKANGRIHLACVVVALAGCADGISEPQINPEDASTARADGSSGGAAGQSAGGTTGAGGVAGSGAGGMTSTGTGGMTSAGTGGMLATGGAGGRGGSTGGAAGMGGVSGSGGDGGGTESPAVRLVGRTAMSSPSGSFQYSWPGVNIHANFTGTQASMVVNNASGNNRVTVVVDGGAPKPISLPSGQSTVSLVSGLASGTHEIVIWRNTEASPGGLTFFMGLTSFGAAGALLAPPSAPARRIEVVGDSLSVGAGVEGNATCTGGIDAYTNNYLAYGSIAARAVSADVVTIAYSGIGVYRNFGETTPTAASLTMPRRYPYAIPDTVLWDFSLYQPQVVVINLGTNDFGPGDPGTAFETAYVSFVQAVRGKYPDAYFILIDMYGGMRLTRLNDVLGTLKSDGESKVEVLSLNAVQNNLGCNQHPNVAGQQGMGNVLAARVRVVMGW
jgi:lysophospholipase L1-like esterase